MAYMYFFYEMQLQGILIVVFIKTNILFKMMNATTCTMMISCKNISWRKWVFYYYKHHICTKIQQPSCCVHASECGFESIPLNAEIYRRQDQFQGIISLNDITGHKILMTSLCTLCS